ncbi:MAG TPA: helix-turn-helix domain-containing protein [Polyangia bacterium]
MRRSPPCVRARSGSARSGSNRSPPSRSIAPATEAEGAPWTPTQISHEQLLEVLERNDFQPARAARELGISRSTIYERIQRDPQVRRVADLSDEELRRLVDECQGDVAMLGKRLQVSVRALRMRLSKLR